MLNASADTMRIGTIAIYLGGVGCKVGQEFWRQMQSCPDDDRGHTEILLIDSEMQRADVPELYPRKQHYYYTNLDDARTAAFQDFADERFPGNLGRVPIPDSSKGAGITRAFAMASLAVCRNSFEEQLASAYVRLREGMQSSHDKGIRIFITASACGGTGAGMVVDAMAIVRAWFHKRGEEAPVISLFLVAPDVVIDDPKTSLEELRRRRMTASSYALMKELNGFASGMPFESDYHSVDSRVALDTTQPNQYLFDWVYFFNRQNPMSSRSYNQDELAWLIAELQTHITRGAIARRVNAIAPNIREQRVARYPLEFQANLQDKRDQEEIDSMGRNSLPAFLASMSIVSARFPAREIKSVLQRHWTWTTLSGLLHGMALFQGMARDVSPKSRLLIRGRADQNSLTPVLFKISDIADEVSTYLNNIGQVDQLLEEEVGKLYVLTSYIARDSDGVAGDEQIDELKRRVNQMKNLCKQASEFEKAAQPAFCLEFLKRLETQLERVLSREGDLSCRLMNSATDPNSAWGLLKLRDAIERMIEDRQRQLSNHRPFATLDTASTLIKKAERKLSSLEQDRRDEEEEANFVTRLIKKVRILVNQSDYISDNDEIDAAEQPVRKAHECVIKDVPTYVRNHALSHIYALEIEALKAFLDRVDLVIQRISTASEFELSALTTEMRQLHQLTGEDKVGPWMSPTMHNIGGDLQTLQMLQDKRFVSEQKISETILQTLNADGIVMPFGTLSVHNLDQFMSDDLNAGIRQSLLDDTILTDQLAQLDKGWHLSELQDLLHDRVPYILDEGSSPLLRVSPSAVSPKTDCWMIVPHGLELPDPFMKSISLGDRYPSAGSDTISVVQAMYGVPPSSCHDMDDWFNDYLEMLGDLTEPDEEMAQSRFPLHIFADGATRFPEVYQPIALVDVSANFDRDLISFAIEHGFVEEGPDTYTAPSFPFSLPYEMHKKLENSEPLDEDEWIAVRRFRLSIAERIRRRCTERPKMGKMIIATLKSDGWKDLKPLLNLLQPTRSHGMEEGGTNGTIRQGLANYTNAIDIGAQADGESDQAS